MSEVTVLMPVHNGRTYLEEAVRSILVQSFHDFELVIVDDGSRDGSTSLLRSLAREDPRIRLQRIRHGGIVEALNAGLAASRGRYVVRMDADDLSRRDRVAMLVKFMDANPGVDVGSSLVDCFGDPPETVGAGYRRYERWINGLRKDREIRRDIFVECPVAHPTMIVRRESLLSMGGYRETGGPEDYDLMLRFYEHGARFGKIGSVLYRWRVHGGNLSRLDERYSRAAFRVLKRDFLVRTALAGHRDLAICGAGPNGKWWCRALQALGWKVHYLVEVDPRKIGKRIHGVPVIAPGEMSRLRGLFTLCAVGSPGARKVIRWRMTRNGLVELRDYICLQ